MRGRTLLLVGGLLACAGVICLPAGVGAQRTSGAAAWLVVSSQHAVVQAGPGVARERAALVAAEMERLFNRVGHDLGEHPPRLQVRLYASHRAYARALAAQHAPPPQSALDDTGAIAGATLLLGPVAVPYLRHNLAHVYTEWIMDGLTHNPGGVLPALPWLYDGLAEYEAERYEPAGMRCALRGPPLLDISFVRTARQWLALRAGPLGPLEYCLAAARAGQLVRRLGWAVVRRTLHHGRPWPVVARRLLAAARLRDAAPGTAGRPLRRSPAVPGVPSHASG